MDVQVRVDDGYADFVDAGTSIGTDGAMGSCVAMVAKTSREQWFCAHISCGIKAKKNDIDTVAERTENLLNGLLPAEYLREYWYCCSDSKDPATKGMIQGINKLYSGKLQAGNKPGASGVAINEDGKVSFVPATGESIKGPTRQAATKCQVE